MKAHLAGNSKAISACQGVPASVREEMRGKGAGKSKPTKAQLPAQSPLRRSPRKAAASPPRSAAKDKLPSPAAAHVEQQAGKVKKGIQAWLDTSTRDNANMAVANMLYELGLPLSMVTKPALAKFVEAVKLAPADWKLPSYDSVRGPLLVKVSRYHLV